MCPRFGYFPHNGFNEFKLPFGVSASLFLVCDKKFAHRKNARGLSNFNMEDFQYHIKM